MERFEQVAEAEKLKRGTKEYLKRRGKFVSDAVRDGFLRHFGTNEASVSAWQAICILVGAENTDGLSSVTKCKKASNSCK